MVTIKYRSQVDGVPGMGTKEQTKDVPSFFEAARLLGGMFGLADAVTGGRVAEGILDVTLTLTPPPAVAAKMREKFEAGALADLDIRPQAESQN